jgi:hypothetical protein
MRRGRPQACDRAQSFADWAYFDNGRLAREEHRKRGFSRRIGMRGALIVRWLMVMVWVFATRADVGFRQVAVWSSFRPPRQWPYARRWQVWGTCQSEIRIPLAKSARHNLPPTCHPPQTCHSGDLTYMEGDPTERRCHVCGTPWRRVIERLILGRSSLRSIARLIPADARIDHKSLARHYDRHMLIESPWRYKRRARR